MTCEINVIRLKVHETPVSELGQSFIKFKYSNLNYKIFNIGKGDYIQT